MKTTKRNYLLSERNQEAMLKGYVYLFIHDVGFGDAIYFECILDDEPILAKVPYEDLPNGDFSKCYEILNKERKVPLRYLRAISA